MVFQLPSGNGVLSSLTCDAVKSISVDKSSAKVMKGKTSAMEGTTLIETRLSTDSEFPIGRPDADKVGRAAGVVHCNATAALRLSGSGVCVAIKLRVAEMPPALHVAGPCALLRNAACCCIVVDAGLVALPVVDSGGTAVSAVRPEEAGFPDRASVVVGVECWAGLCIVEAQARRVRVSAAPRRFVLLKGPGGPAWGRTGAQMVSACPGSLLEGMVSLSRHGRGPVTATKTWSTEEGKVTLILKVWRCTHHSPDNTNTPEWRQSLLRASETEDQRLLIQRVAEAAVSQAIPADVL
ncbi:hypothetical protein HPB51_016583 [Rhipicephalus microplus]|uniref:Uncharacterized protein n=1 Tax=Rhipicephalus microplus TaxID=6941 RepID=A0A9J6DVR6_RHIMP|nr:hypothetical protein HPB51_016583 [Rhipicephalus microplus]